MLSQQAATLGCADLIGKSYRLGADGSDDDGAIDCIHVVYKALAVMDIPVPVFDPGWYTASNWQIARSLLKWGRRIISPLYDGDVLLLQQDYMAFGVVWSQGILHINNRTKKVAWCGTDTLMGYHAFRCSHLNVN